MECQEKYSLSWALDASQKIEGWLALNEAEVLYNLAAKIPYDTNIVEIGSYKGRSTVVMAASMKHNIKQIATSCLISIDPHKKPDGQISASYNEWNKGTYKNSLTDFYRNIYSYEVADIIYPIRATSEQAKKDELADDLKIGLLFIDGLHEKKWVELDCELWTPLVVSGGWVAFHDANKNNEDFYESAGIVAYEEIVKSGKYKNVGFCKSLVYGEKI